MKYNLNFRRLIIKEYKSLQEADSLISVTLFELAIDQKINLDDITIEIDKITSEKRIDGFEVEDTRKRFEFGASGFGQEVIFAIMVRTTSGLSAEIIKHLWTWSKQRIKATKTNETRDDIKNNLDKIKDIICTYFSETEKIKILEISKTISGTKAILEDGTGNKYKITLLPNGNIITIKKITKTYDSKSNQKN